MKKWNLLLVLALLFVACKDEYDVNLDELYGKDVYWGWMNAKS